MNGDLTQAEYRAMQDRIKLIAQLVADTDDVALTKFIGQAERADTLGAYLDPTAWMHGHPQLRLVIDHARALSTFRKAVAP